MKDVKSYRWKYLAAGSIGLLFAGVIYAWSILKSPLSTEFGWTAAQLGFNYTITISLFCMSSVVCGLLGKKLSVRIRMIIGAVLVLAGFLIASKMSGKSIAPLYIGYGFLAGAGIGFEYNCIITSVSAWYQDKKGMCSGVLLMFFGGSSLIIGKVSSALIDMESVGWRTTYVLLAVSTAVILILAAFVIKLPPEGTVLPKATPKKGVSDIPEAMEITGGALLKRLSFWKMFILFLCMSAVGSTAISFAKDITMFVGSSAQLAVTVVGIISICNGVGRIILGFTYDAIGMRKTQVMMGISIVLAPAVTLIAVINGSLVLGIIGLCLCGIVYGFCPTMSAAMMMSFYGAKHYPVNFSMINMVLFPASFSATLTGITVTSTGGYTVAFIVLCALACVALVADLSIKRP